MGLAEPLAAARLKLLAALPATTVDGAARVGERFHLDAVDWYRHNPPPTHLPAIAQAVWQDRRISIHYESWSATTRRRVDPLGLVMKAGSWYMVARTGANVRTFKIANVLELDVLDDTFEHPPGFDLAAHWRDSLQRFERSLQRGTCPSAVSRNAMSRLDRLSAAAMEAVVASLRTTRDGEKRPSRSRASLDAAGALISFGDDVVVIGPPELRGELARRAAEVVAMYS